MLFDYVTKTISHVNVETTELKYSQFIIIRQT